MSETSSPRRVLHLVVEGASPERIAELSSPNAGAATEVLVLTEATAREALEKIFAADTVTVWGEVK